MKVDQGEYDQLSPSHIGLAGASDSPPWSYVDTPCNPPFEQYNLLAYRHWHNISKTPARMGNISYVLLISAQFIFTRLQHQHHNSAPYFYSTTTQFPFQAPYDGLRVADDRWWSLSTLVDQSHLSWFVSERPELSYGKRTDHLCNRNRTRSHQLCTIPTNSSRLTAMMF